MAGRGHSDPARPLTGYDYGYGMTLADRAAAGHQAGWLKLYDRLGHGWAETHEGFVAGVSGLPAPPFNNATVYRDCDPAELVEVVSRIADSGYPFSLQTRPAVTDGAVRIAEQFGMERQPGMPLMGLTDPPTDRAVAGLSLRRLNSDEAETHASIAADAFGAPLELMMRLTTPETMQSPDVHFLGGDIRGTTVTTAMVDVNDATAWIYNVATLGAHRRRGLGAAITAATVRAAFAAGATAVFLLSSPAGVHVYESVGFRQLEWWSSWSHGANS